MRKFLSAVIYQSRWILYPVNIALLLALLVYVGVILVNDFRFIIHFSLSMDYLMMGMLGLVDAAMVANLMIMVAQGSHQIFITKFETDKEERPQYLDHIDSTQLKVKVAMSVSSIMLIQVLRDFFNLEKTEWPLVVHHIMLHAMSLITVLIFALIWRVMHPKEEAHAVQQH